MGIISIYRVYESFQLSNESGAYEYGFYIGENAHEEAMRRAKQVAERKYPKLNFEEKSWGYYSWGMCGSTSIIVSEYPVNTPLEDNCTGYT